MSDESKPVTRAELDREIGHLRLLIETVLSERGKTLELQALEYQRRLGELNQAHERAERAVQLTVPRDLFEQHVAETAKWRETVNQEFAAIRGASSGSAKRFTIVTTIMFLAFAAMTIWITLKQNEKPAPVPVVGRP